LRSINSSSGNGVQEDPFDFDAFAISVGLDPYKDIDVLKAITFYRLKRKFLTMLEDRCPELKNINKG
jgi:hypothetical protein